MFSCTSVDAPAPGGCLCHRPEIAAATRRLTRRGLLAGFGAAALASASASAAAAQPQQPAAILLTHARLFDGTASAVREGVSVLVRGNRIAGIADGTPPAPDGTQVIDCRGGVLMPGLIDAHWHSLLAGLPMAALMSAEVGYVFLAGAAEAERTLLRGFTTIRDLGGPSFALKQAIDQGLVAGPRIYPSGAMITTTGGHGDLRPLDALPRRLGDPASMVERIGAAGIADSLGELRLRVREQLMQGASQVKIVGGGGVSSPRSPLDMTTFDLEALRAAVSVAEDWNTYVAVHAYTPRTVQRAVAAGARCIEHAHLMDEATAALIAEKGVWLSIQPFVDAAETGGALTGPSLARKREIVAGTDGAYRLAKAHGVKTAFGSDLLFSAELAARQGTMLTHLARWYSNAEVLRMATAGNAELLALAGPRNPYPERLGVIAENAAADLLVIDGNPLEDISLMADPARSLALIMKDGRVHRSRLT